MKHLRKHDSVKIKSIDCFQGKDSVIFQNYYKSKLIIGKEIIDNFQG